MFKIYTKNTGTALPVLYEAPGLQKFGLKKVAIYGAQNLR